MINGLGFKLANVPTITGLSTVSADSVVSESINTESLFVNGVDVSVVLTQVPINTANIATLQQLTTGISYSDTGGIDLTTVDNNMTVSTGKKLKSATVATDTDDVVNKLYVDNLLIDLTGISYSNAGGIDLTTIDNNLTITSGKKLKCATTATANEDVANKLFVDTAIANLVDSAPATLDTLNELANALGDDPNFATTVTNLIAGKVSLTGNETIAGVKTFSNQLVSSAPGGGYAPTAYFADSTIGNNNFIGIIPYSGSGAFNNFPATGDGLIYAIRNVIDTKSLALTTWSSTTNGIRISPSSVLIGAGGTAALPTARILCSGTTVSITAPTCAISNQATFGDNITLNNVNQNNRQINNTVYNLYDGAAVAGGVYRAKLYSTASTITFDLDTPTAFGIYTAGANNIFNVSNTDCTIKTTNNPTIIGFTDPIASDSSSKIASTRWVQSAITASASTTISTTATPTQPYYLVGSISSTTSSDTTLYKNIKVYVNPATGGICCNDFNIYNTNTEAFNSSFSSLSQFEFRNDSTSAPNTTVFYNNNSVGTPTAVLTLNGNAGASTFDGLASASTTVAVADNNTSTTMYPVFTTTGAGQKSLLFDISISSLSYTPSTGTLRALIYSIPTTIASTIGSSSANVLITNNNIGGALQHIVATSGIPLTTFSNSETSTSIRSPTTIVAGSVGSASSLVVSDAGSPARSFQFVPNASGGVLNALTILNDSLLYGTAGSVGTGALTLSMWSNTTTGVRITPTTALIGAGGTGSTPSSYASFQASGITIGGATNMRVGTGASSTRAFKVDESGGVGISMLPNSTVGSYNPLIAVNDSVIFADNTAINTSDLVLTTWSATTCGVRINSTSALIGAGGAGATPTAYVSCSDTTVTVKGELQVTDRNLLVDAGVNALTIGNGASTATSNILITRTSLAQTRAFTTGGNTIIGNVAGNALVVASANNTFIGTSAGSTATGSNNICIGNSAQVPTVGNNNQIAIGTVAETMYIRGGFNLRVGAQITSTATGNLATAVLAQFYTVAMSVVSQTIALPNPTTAAYLGAMVTFKRKSNATIFTITSTGGAVFIPIGSITGVASPISIGATIFQVTLVCDGTNWCIISQA